MVDLIVHCFWSLLPFFSLYLLTGTYSNYWKTANIKPHYKFGDTTDMNKYHSIHMNLVIYRIMEIILVKMKSSTTYSPKNFSLILNKASLKINFVSPVTFISSLKSLLNITKDVLVLCFKIYKRFGTVKHQLIIGKLVSYRVKNPPLA